MNPSPRTGLLQRLENKTALIGIVGLGCVSLPVLLNKVRKEIASVAGDAY